MAKLGTRAIVVGSSMTGLLVARVLCDHFEQVTLLDRDDEPVAYAHRRGVPQSKHLHMLLRAGQDVLDALFPGIDRELADAGSVPLRAGYDIINIDGLGEWPRRDLGFTSIAQSRTLLEQVVRGRVAALRNVEMRWGCRVDGILCDSNKRGVVGVRYHADGVQHELAADLTVDCAGRQARTVDWLRELGYSAPEQTCIEVDIGYASTFFAIPSPTRLPGLGLLINPAVPAKRGGVVQTVEGGRWHVTLAGRLGDHPPTDLKGYREFAKSLPSPMLYDAIADLDPLEPIAGFRYPASIRQRFEKLEAFPEGLLTLGDALCSFNPIYGQGLSSAALQAQALGRLLDEGARTQVLWRRFFPIAAEIVATPWVQAGSTDLAYPETVGARPPNFEAAQAFGAALAQLALEDAEIHKLLLAVMQLITPRSALRDPALIERVVRRIQENAAAGSTA